MIKKVDRNITGKRQKNKKKNVRKVKNNKDAKFNFRIFLIIIIVSVVAIFTIIQSARMVMIFGTASKNIIDDFINGEETSYNYYVDYTEMRG